MEQSNVVKLAPNTAKRSAARDLRTRMFEKCRTGVKRAGDDIAGFALVVWDRNGDLWSSYDAQIGVIGPALVPTLAHDSLNRHVAVVLAAEKATADSGG